MRISLEEFVGTYKIGRSLGEGFMEARTKTLRPKGEGRPFGEYKLHEGRYAIDPERDNSLRDVKGVAIVATFDGLIVGSVNAEHFWVHPAHRGAGLGEEMMFERITKIGIPEWLESSKANFGLKKPVTFTESGLAARKRTYRLLVERGYIEES
jgi:GNAT superfamily N-acetyltransferase